MSRSVCWRKPITNLLLALSALCTLPALAATCTATGNGSWNLPATWSGCGGGVPGAADTAQINAGRTVVIPTGETVSVAAIEFGATGFTYGLTVDGTLTVGDLAHRGSAVIDGIGAITVNGTYDWTGNNSLLRGQLRGDGTAPPLTFAPGSVWNLAGVPMRLIQRAVVQQGTANFSAGDIACSSTVTWLIDAGAVLNISHTGAIGSGGANCLIRNEGTIRKTGAGTVFRLTDFRVRLENHGIIEVLAGSFDFDAGGGPTTHTGIFRTSAGATLGTPRSGPTFSAGVRFEGAGTVTFSGSGLRTFAASVDFDGPVILEGSGSSLLAQAGATLDFLAGMSWNGGLLRGPGSFRLPPGRTLTLASSQTKTLSESAQLLLEGSTLWQGGELSLAPGGALPQTRLFNASGASFQVLFRPATISMGGSGNSVVENAGTFTASAAADSGLLTIGFGARGTVLNRGTMALAGAVRTITGTWRQTAGQLLLDDAQLTLTAASFNLPLELAGGVLAGDAVFTGLLRNTGGLILPGGVDAIGTIGVVGRYEEDVGAVMELEIGGTALNAHDRFVVASAPGDAATNGSAALAGSLSVRQRAGFQFGPGDAVTPLIAVSRIGTFAAIDVDTGFAPQPQVFLLSTGVLLGLDAALFADGFEAP